MLGNKTSLITAERWDSYCVTGWAGVATGGWRREGRKTKGGKAALGEQKKTMHLLAPSLISLEWKMEAAGRGFALWLKMSLCCCCCCCRCSPPPLQVSPSQAAGRRTGDNMSPPIRTLGSPYQSPLLSPPQRNLNTEIQLALFPFNVLLALEGSAAYVRTNKCQRDVLRTRGAERSGCVTPRPLIVSPGLASAKTCESRNKNTGRCKASKRGVSRSAGAAGVGLNMQKAQTSVRARLAKSQAAHF